MKKILVPTSEPTKKLNALNPNKLTKTRLFDAELPNFANNCLQNTVAKLPIFTDWCHDLVEKIRGDFVGVPSISFTYKVIFDETSQQRRTTPLCGLILANYTIFRYVNLYWLAGK